MSQILQVLLKRDVIYEPPLRYTHVIMDSFFDSKSEILPPIKFLLLLEPQIFSRIYETGRLFRSPTQRATAIVQIFN